LPECDGSLGTNVELEMVLMMVSGNPESTAQRISGITSLAGYQFISRPSRTLRDVYLDTLDRELGSKRINLRIRGIDGEFWLTMKIFPRRLSWKRRERLEIEVPWSQESLARILGELAKRGVRLKKVEVNRESSPLQVLLSIGLRVLQDRETWRSVRDVVGNDSSSEILAELDIDQVLYHFEGQDVRLFEVEIEAKSKKGRSVLGIIAKQLLVQSGPELKQWRYGKLVTGRKVEKLLKDGALEADLDGSTLRPTAFEKIERE